jgi:transcriptional regulator with XRE-family HTH domain
MSTAQSSKRHPTKAARKGRNPSLSALVRWAMERQGMSGNQLAQHAGLNQSIVSRLVSGRRSNAMPETLEALSLALDLPMSQLWAARRVSRSLAATGTSQLPDGETL